MLALFDILCLVGYFGVLCISGNIIKTDSKPSTFGAYNTHFTPTAKVIKTLMTQVKEIWPKEPNVDHSKPTRPKLGRAKLARA